MTTPWLMDARAGGACEVDWTWLSANDQVGESMLVVRRDTFSYSSFTGPKTFLRVSKTVTRPCLTAKTINNPVYMGSPLSLSSRSDTSHTECIGIVSLHIQSVLRLIQSSDL